MLPVEPVPEDAVDDRAGRRYCEYCEDRSCETLGVQGCLEFEKYEDAKGELDDTGEGVQGFVPPVSSVE